VLIDNMDGDGDETPNLRRSGRIRTQISYRDLARLSETPGSEVGTPQSLSSPSTLVYDSDDSTRGNRKARRRNDDNITVDDEKEFRAVKLHGKSRARSEYLLASKEGRLTSIAGTSATSRMAVAQRLETWKEIFEEIPDELVDFTIGWGVYTGDWNGEGGSGQKLTTIADE
jgi:hypothetical protein